MPEVRELLEEVGLPSEAAERVTIVGRDPVLATAFPVGEAAAAALGACGAAAAAFGDIGQEVRVDVRRAAASLVSFALQQVEGGGATFERLERALVAPYECRDGRWVHLHGAFEHLAAGTCRVLGIRDREAEDSHAVAAAVKRFDAEDLEDLLASERMCGAMARTAGEWERHPQGRAMASRNRVEITHIGPGAAEPLRSGRETPLAGIRVLDLTRVLAGPTTGRTLASHGAEVLLVNAPQLPNVLPFVVDTSHGKRSTSLDLDDPEDAARLRELAREADVFVNGYRAGSLERHGLGPDDLAALRPGIVYASVNCYGHQGPWAARPGWEQLAQVVTGIATGHDPHARPQLIPAAACDYTTGYLTALGVMTALHRRAAVGGSWHVQTSLVQTAMWFRHIGEVCDPSAASGLGAIAELTVTSDSGFGRLRHLPPAVDMSVTQPHWDLPTVPIGTHPPRWETRRAPRP